MAERLGKGTFKVNNILFMMEVSVCKHTFLGGEE